MDNNIISEIKKRINILDLISNYVTLKKIGHSYVGLCPFHNEKTGSFNVIPEKGFYKCFGCGESGDIFSFIQKYENVEFSDALKILAEKAGVQIETDVQSIAKKSEKDEIYLANGYAIQFYKNKLKESVEGLSYLNRRGITIETINKFSLGFSPDSWNELRDFLRSKKLKDDIGIKAGLLKESDKNSVFDMFRNRIMYPIWTSLGKPIGFGGRIMDKGEPKYLNTSETPVFSKSKEFYALNFAKEAIVKLKQVIIVEGYMDVIACHSQGIENVIAVLGTALTNEHINKIKRYTDNIVLCFDADKAGIKAALRNGALLLEQAINPLIAVTPKGEDPDSFLQKHKSTDFLKIINDAVPLLDFEIDICLKNFDLKDVNDKINALTEVCKIVAKEQNAIKRDAYVNNLLYLHPNPQSENARRDIREEINKHIGANKGKFKETILITDDVPNKYKLTQKIILYGVCDGFFDLYPLLSLEPEDFDQGVNRELFLILKDFILKEIAPTRSQLEYLMREKGYIKEFFDILTINENLNDYSIDELISILIIKRNKSKLDRRKILEQKLNDSSLNKDELKELMIILRGK